MVLCIMDLRENGRKGREENMRSFRQLMRQPLKTVMGIFLTMGACCALCICVAQFVSSRETQRQLESLFQPVGYPSSDYQKEFDEWLCDYRQENPEALEKIYAPGLVSAYAPRLVPDNFTRCPAPRYTSADMITDDNWQYLPNLSSCQYRCAMLLITLEEVGEPTHELRQEIPGPGGPSYGAVQSQRISVPLKGRVENVVGLEQGYNNPAGFTAKLSLVLPDEKALEKLDLTLGQKYLVYGKNYFDGDYSFRSSITDFDKEMGGPFPFIQSFDLDRLYVLQEDEISGPTTGPYESLAWATVVATYEFEDGRHLGIRVADMERLFRIVNLTLWDQSSMPLYTYEFDFLGHGMETAHQERTFRNQAGETVTMDLAEYHRRYQEPTIARIDTTVEAFLESEEGKLWAEALRDIEINSHAFPVIGVEELGFLPDFLNNAARISQGRDFTRQEQEKGERVCILSETLAQQNGIAVGDTVSLQTYRNDLGVPCQLDIASGNGACRPMANYFFGGSMALDPEESYTVVGLYQQDTPWCAYFDNLYAITPNTIFVPWNTVVDKAEYSHVGLFRGVKLSGRYLDQFLSDVGMAGYGGQLLVNDSGYTAAAQGVESYTRIAGTAVAISGGVFLLVLFLFVALYPGLLKKPLFTMECLGANRRERISFILESAYGILLPGTLLGLLVGRIGWNYLTAALQSSTGAENIASVSVGSFLLAGLIQLILFSAATMLAAIPLSRDIGMRKR